MSSKSEATIAVLKAWMAAHSAKDKEAVLALMSEDIYKEIPFDASGSHEDGHYRVWRDKAGVAEFLDSAYYLVERIRFFDVEMTPTEDGSTVFIEFRGDGVTRTGRPYRNRFCVRATVRDGLIVHLREYLNPVTGAVAFDRLVAGVSLKAQASA